ncbi:hypothetical protein [Streptomyces sp. NPDC050560]|uniref:hypothetical protein n=1 Tax=Streptomyces sp. NPDC050560 TaxID=3365630 RepID=UPI0037B760C4
MTSPSAPPVSSGQPARKCRRHWLLPLTVAVVLVVGGVLVLEEFVGRSVDGQAAHDSVCCWEKDAGPDSVSHRIGVRIPASAVDRRAGVKTNARYTTAILAFTLPTRDAESYLARLVPGDVTMVAPLRPGDPVPAEPDSSFRHLRLPEPSRAGPSSGTRTISLCSDAASEEAARLRHCVDVYRGPAAGAHDTRLYFRSAVAGQ